MRLYKILENVVQDGYARSPKVAEMLRDMKAHSRMAPVFDFGDIGPISIDSAKDMFRYVKELADNGMLSLPFEKMVLCYSYGRQGQVSDFSFIAQDLGDTIELVTMVSCNCRIAGIGGTTMTKVGMFAESHEAVISKEMEKKSREQALEDLQKVMPCWFFALIGLLNAKGVEQRITPPRHALNKRRIAAGKQPIGEIREVMIKVGSQSYYPSGREEKGGHASPRLHWRRGHIRRLPSGELTHVRPCLVGNRVGGEEPAKKDYRVAV